MPTLRLVVSAGAIALAGCARGVNYASPEGPRYAGGPSAMAASVAAGAIRLVTFNIKYSIHVDSAISVLRGAPELGNADVVALQEVDAGAAERIAGALGMRYVYYPATLHPSYNRDFGNAVLTRWPILADRKLVLPHLGRFRKTLRIATAATISVGGVDLRVYSAHLGTLAEVGPGSKRDQMHAIMSDAAGYQSVVIMGDMNSHDIGEELLKDGYRWPTEKNRRTISFGNWDHVFLKGIQTAGDLSTGVVADNHRASDHRPVWVEIARPGAGNQLGS